MGAAARSRPRRRWLPGGSTSLSLTRSPLSHLPSQYEGGEPCGICGHRLAEAEQPKPQTPSAMPTEVLPGFLFLGTYDHASRAELLKTLGIGNILNVRGPSWAVSLFTASS